MLRRIVTASTVVIALFLLTTACGGDSAEELAIEDFAQAYSAEFCGKLYACCDQDELTDLQGSNYTDEASCTSYFTNLTQDYIVSLMQAAIAAGRGEYNAETAASCLEAYAARGCAGAAENDLSSLQGACEDFYVGLGQGGADCENALECVDGHYCADGTCTAFAQENDTCVAGETVCASGLYCDGSNCVPRLGVGQQCASATQCESGLVCDATSGECATPSPEDQICDGQ